MVQESVVICGNNNLYILFKCAFHYAELGFNIWFISPKSINEIPENLTTPNKQVLGLITFLYLNDLKDLLDHLSGIHIWQKVPNIIILTGYEKYCNLQSSDYVSDVAAFATASLVDTLNFVSRKHARKALLIVSCKEVGNTASKLDILVDLYFDHRINVKQSDNLDDVVNNVVSLIKLT